MSDLIDMSDLVGDFNLQSYMVERKVSGGQYVAGRWQEGGSPSILSRVGNVQLTDTRRLNIVSEGSRTTAAITVTSSGPLDDFFTDRSVNIAGYTDEIYIVKNVVLGNYNAGGFVNGIQNNGASIVFFGGLGTFSGTLHKPQSGVLITADSGNPDHVLFALGANTNGSLLYVDIGTGIDPLTNFDFTLVANQLPFSHPNILTLDYSKSGINKIDLATQLLAAGYDLSAFEIMGPTTADMILYQGKRWKVIQVADWSANGYWYAVAVEQRDD